MEIKAGKVSYYVYAYTEGMGSALNITKAVDDLSWEENEKEFSAKITFRIYNAKYDGKKLSSLIKIGMPVVIKADWGSGRKDVCIGYTKSAERDTTKSSETYKITAYDCAYAMLKAQDSIYYAEGKTTKSIISTLFAQWGVILDQYTGPDVKHSKIVYKNKYISDIILGILDEAAKKGGKKAIVRATRYKQVSVLEQGSNTDVFEFTTQNSIESRYTISIENLVTRVKIVAYEKESDQAKVEAVVEGDTSYGVLQRVQTHSQSDDLSEAKKAAQEILDENGKPKETMHVQAPDVPPIRKGDKIKVTAGALNGYYLVKSIQHNAAQGKMNMEVEKM